MNPQAKTLVCFALEEEAREFRKLVRTRPDVAVLITGIGSQNAERAVREFLGKTAPQQVFSCGFAGALDPQLQVGEVVFQTVDWLLDKHLVQAGGRPASFYCAQRIAVTAAEKAQLRTQTKASAVDMESATIQQVCRDHGALCAIVRAISDTAAEDLPLDFNALSNPDLSLNYGRLALAIARSPGRIPALLRLQRNCRFAARQLAKVLHKIIQADLPPPERPPTVQPRGRVGCISW